MKNFIDLVNNRYSVRKFKDTPVKREDIEKCLEAARLAPSACNSQPWKFIIIDAPALKEEFCRRVFTGVFGTNKFANQAPVIVAVISEKANFLSKVGSMVRDTRFYLIDIGIAVEHFILQAAELKLGTCWMGWFNEKEAKNVLSLPKNARVDIVFPLGYPDQPLRNKVRKSIKEISSYN